MSLPEALEHAADALPKAADAIRDANGDPSTLLLQLEASRAVEVLGWMLAHETGAGAELAESWAEQEGGAERIAAIDESALPKPARKALRRLRHSLRTRGVTLIEPQAAAPRVARLPAIEEAIDAAFVLPLDARGARMIYLVEPRPSGGCRLAEAVVDEVRGIVEFAVYAVARGRVRTFIRALERRGEAGAVAVEPATARRMLARLCEHQPASRRLPKAFADNRTRFRIADDGGPTPGQLASDSLGEDAGNREALRTIEEQVKSGEIGPWPPGLEQLRQVAESFEERASGRIIVSEGAKRGRMADAIAETAAEIFDADFGAITAARFRETAYVFWKTDREEEARGCLSAAAAFEALSPGDNPVAIALTERMLAPLLAKLEQEGQQQEETASGKPPELLSP